MRKISQKLFFFPTFNYEFGCLSQLTLPRKMAIFCTQLRDLKNIIWKGYSELEKLLWCSIRARSAFSHPALRAARWEQTLEDTAAPQPRKRQARRATARLLAPGGCADGRRGKHMSKWKPPESFSLPNFCWKMRSFKKKTKTKPQTCFPSGLVAERRGRLQRHQRWLLTSFASILKERTPSSSWLFVSYQDRIVSVLRLHSCGW